jgi:hypothetical protein
VNQNGAQVKAELLTEQDEALRMASETQRRQMELIAMQVIAGSCPNGQCPAVFDLGTGDLLIQGYVSTDVTTPADESVVRVPASVILEAAEALRAGAAR